MIKANVSVSGGEFPEGHVQNKKLYFARSFPRLMALCNSFVGFRKAMITVTYGDGTKKEIPMNQE